MVRTVEFRKRSPFGSLAAELTAEAIPSPVPPAQGVQIHRNVWLLATRLLYWKDLAWLGYGASLHGEELSRRHPEGLCILVRDLSFPGGDHRSEVAAFVMDCWLREEYELADQGIRVDLHAGEGTYAFYWGAGRYPFTDDDF